MIFSYAFKSLINRRLTTGLTILTIAISVILLLGIERIKTSARESFEKTVSGVDLIAGARSGNINLLLYTVFHMGNATNNVSWKTYEHFSAHPAVKWTVPISLGDSHKGFRVVGTTSQYFDFIKYAGGRNLQFESGKPFDGVFETVLGSDVAKKLKYNIGTALTLSHGTGEISFQEHTDKPFHVVGILKPTGTPMDRSVYISLQAMDAIHEEHQQGELPDHEITAFFLGLKSKIAIFRVQRDINEYEKEPLSAILPGVSLTELWQMLNVAEAALLAISAMVFVCSLVSMLLALLSTLNERRREMAIYRSVGTAPGFVFAFLIFEALLLAVLGIITGLVVLNGALFLAQPLLETKLGLQMNILKINATEIYYILFIIIGAIAVGIIPGWKAYRNSLADGLSVRT